MISGQGVTEEPVGLFKLDQKTGMVRITGPVDREKNPVFNVSHNVTGFFKCFGL